MFELLTLHAVDMWIRTIADLAFYAECPSPEAVPDAWAQTFRDDINAGRATVIAWLDDMNGKPWPEAAPMTCATMSAFVSSLGSDALHLVTTIQNADCWGVRYSSWPCVADRELVDRVRSRATAIRDIVRLLTAIATEEAAPVAPLPATALIQTEHATATAAVTPPPPLEKDDVKILEELARRKGIVAYQVDIGVVGPDRASERLRYLASIGYVVNPPGKSKRGWTLTAAGMSRLAELPAVD